MTLTEISPTTVLISWMQDSRDTYNNFTISYTYDGPCSINGITTTDLTTQSNAWDEIYQYTITDLQEFSNYTLIVYAVTSAGRSLPTSSNTVKFRTKSEGKFKLV